MKKVLLMLGIVAVIGGCSSIDCPLNNTVYANYELAGPVTSLPDTLTISTTRMDGNDSVLINRQSPTTSFSLPMSYNLPADTLFMQTGSLLDTITVAKTNEPHFESVDCGVNYFHTITGVRYTRHAIDSLVINNNSVTYDASQTHFRIYFKEYRL